ncbi:MAG: hypothetical protein HQL18_02580 [Candidatus Omnitrophica bacterium]|nr:hypothetical protein [Candidatus Omnitrophota bacterium]
MLKKNKKTNEKISIQEYLKKKALLSKKRFGLQPYPWPVTLALLIPLSVFLTLLLSYIFYVRGLGD